jgi:hypothetical protein
MAAIQAPHDEPEVGQSGAAERRWRAGLGVSRVKERRRAGKPDARGTGLETGRQLTKPHSFVCARRGQHPRPQELQPANLVPGRRHLSIHDRRERLFVETATNPHISSPLLWSYTLEHLLSDYAGLRH